MYARITAGGRHAFHAPLRTLLPVTGGHAGFSASRTLATHPDLLRLVHRRRRIHRQRRLLVRPCQHPEHFPQTDDTGSGGVPRRLLAAALGRGSHRCFHGALRRSAGGPARQPVARNHGCGGGRRGLFHPQPGRGLLAVRAGALDFRDNGRRLAGLHGDQRHDCPVVRPETRPGHRRLQHGHRLREDRHAVPGRAPAGLAGLASYLGGVRRVDPGADRRARPVLHPAVPRGHGARSGRIGSHGRNRGEGPAAAALRGKRGPHLEPEGGSADPSLLVDRRGFRRVRGRRHRGQSARVRLCHRPRLLRVCAPSSP